jgi:hypothetical protein
MAGKLSIILIVVTLSAMLLVACSPTVPVVPVGLTEIPQTATPVKCSDAGCLQPYFLSCTSSVMTMPFVEGSFFTITVFGTENDLCHYAATIMDKDGKSIPGGPPSADCRVPIEKISEDTFGHFFGQGTDSIKAEQDKIENDFCVIK